MPYTGNISDLQAEDFKLVVGMGEVLIRAVSKARNILSLVTCQCIYRNYRFLHQQGFTDQQKRAVTYDSPLTSDKGVRRMTAIDKLIQTADNEVGYLEKSSNSQLDDKTANAGMNNYTKYWLDIKNEYQGQPWCAVFVTWCFTKTFGVDKAHQLLKHYPYVYCPTMSGLFKLYANPKRGDIVIFNHNGVFTHTGIVTGVDGDYFATVEGNTSAGSAVVANGGGVCRKGYYISNLAGTKFCRPDYETAEKRGRNYE